MTEQAHAVSLPVVWVGVDELPVYSANQFLGQIQGGDVYLTLGIVTPPLLPSSEAEAVNRLNELTYVPARGLARVALTKERLDELVGVLQEMQQMYETDRQRRDEGGQ